MVMTTEPPPPAYNHDMAYLIGGASWLIFWFFLLWPLVLICFGLMHRICMTIQKRGVDIHLR
jgi:hypothetical protein